MIAVSLCVMIVWIGLYPSPFLRMINGSIGALVERLEQAKPGASSAAEVPGRARRDVTWEATLATWPTKPVLLPGSRLTAAGHQTET
jgi:hypothetical protein